MPGPRRRRVYTDTAAQVRGRVVASLRNIVGSQLDDAAGNEVLRTARAYDHVALRQLDEDLAARPLGLRSAVADGPWVTVRVAHALAGRGFTVVLPRCRSCGQEKIDLKRPTPEGRCCNWCVTRRRLQVCGRCLQLGHPVASRPEGTICRRCYNADDQFVRPCAGCGKAQPPTSRTAGGGVLCWACAPRPKRACGGCGEMVTVKANTAAGPVCARCYRYPERACGGCGRVAPIAQRAGGADPDLCHRCRREPVYGCAVCSRSRPAKALWPIGPVCSACQLHALRHPSACPSCRRTRILVGRAPDGRPVCGPCAGSELDYCCHACGTVTDLASAERCARCALAEQVRERLAGPDGSVADSLRPFADLLIGARRPLSVLRWLYRYPGTVLPALAAAPQPITHATIDALPQSHRLSHLRSLLVHAGVLAAREEKLERITPWLADLVADRPAAHQVLIRPYATWAVLRAARRAAARGRYGRARADRDRLKILTALRLLDWLDGRHLQLTDMTQTELDRWQTEHPQQHPRAALRAFLAWTAQRGLTGKLDISIPVPGQPRLFLGEHEHLEQLRRCIHDHGLPLEVRVAGSLLLLFARRSRASFG